MSLTRNLLLSAAGALAFTVSTSQAAVIFADDFSDADGTVLNGKAPDVGISWEQTSGTEVTVQGGRIDTTGAARVIFGNFTALGADEPLLILTADVTLISHNGGFAGISLFQGDSERIFLGDLSGETTTWGLSIAGVGDASSESYSGPNTLTLTYDFNTGLTQLFDGAAPAGNPLISLNAEPGLAFNRFRIANNNGGDIALAGITVQTAPIPEPGSAALLAAGLALAGASRRRRK